MLWTACCLGYFGFLRVGEFPSNLTDPPAIRVSGVAVDSHTSPSMVRIHLQRAKTDVFGKGVFIYLGRTRLSLCPVAALLNCYMVVQPPGKGPLLIHRDGTPLSRECFIKGVRAALTCMAAHINTQGYSGHSFRIGATTVAGVAGVPAHQIRLFGRWTSDAYLLYIRMPRGTLAAVSQCTAE